MQVKAVTYGMQELGAGLAAAPDIAQAELLAAMTEATALLEAEVKGNYPAHSGLTRGSITSQAFATSAGVLGVVGSAAPVAGFIELGTRPHTPPLEPLLQWVADVLGKTGDEGMAAALGIQRKIKARGSQPRPLFANALAKHLPAIELMFQRAAGRVGAQVVRRTPGGPGSGFAS